MKTRRGRPTPSPLTRRKHERRKTELLGGVLVAALVVSIFLASSLDRFLIGTRQYAAVVSAVLVDLANTDRTTASLNGLTINPVLVAAAQAKADDMAKYSYFAHVSPQGADPWHWFEVVGYKFNYAGENLAVDFNDSSDVNSAWMNSPTHRENILDPHFTEIGIAVAQGMYQGHPTTFVVQEFGAPSSQSRAIASQTIPETPTQPALASATSPAVLGEATQTSPAKAKVAVASAQKQIKTTGSGIAAATPAPEYAPWWQHLMASPREALTYAYYLLAFLVIVGLALTTGFELRWHHRHKAAAAGFVLALICILFVLGGTFVFVSPTLTPNASMIAAAGAAF